MIVTDKSPLLWEYYDSSYNVIATEYEGYIVNFGRSVNGTAPYSADLSMVDTLSSDEICAGKEKDKHISATRF